MSVEHPTHPSSQHAPGRGPDKAQAIIINGRSHATTARDLTFEEITALAFPALPVGPTTFFTVTYRRGQGNKPEGSLVQGQSTKIKEGMIFNVAATDKS